jgi:acyl-CoA reductase-like NAD-dependent aldehyde dehydrogenase
MTGQRTARHWIGGEWVDQGPQRHSINPADGKVIGTYCDGGAQAAEAAIEKCCTMSSHAP